MEPSQKLLDKKSRITKIALTALIVLAVGAIAVQAIRNKESNVIETIVQPNGLDTAQTAPTPTGKYQLIIDKLGINVPIIENVSGTKEREYLKAIEKGVAHYQGTALPGEAGNAFIFGHSSFYKEHQYKEIFKNINQLAVGDTFIVNKEGEKLTYKVNSTKIIKDNDLSVLDVPKNSKEIITLMTCWPPGTIAKRYIVQADRVTDTVAPASTNSNSIVKSN